MQHSVWQAPVLAWYSKDLYRDVGRNWGAKPFLYLLMMQAVLWIPMLAKFHAGISEFVRGPGAQVIDQLPQITVENGVVSVDVEQPYYIKSPEEGELLGIIDTTGQTTSLEGTSAFALLTRTAIMIRQKPNEIRVHDLSSVEHFTLDRETVRGRVEAVRKWAAVAAYPFAVAFSYVYRLVQALIYALIGLAFARSTGVDLGYAAVLRLALVAITPVLVGTTLLGVLGVTFPAAWVVWFTVAVGYLVFAVSANRRGPPRPAGDGRAGEPVGWEQGYPADSYRQ